MILFHVSQALRVCRMSGVTVGFAGLTDTVVLDRGWKSSCKIREMAMVMAPTDLEEGVVFLCFG